MRVNLFIEGGATGPDSKYLQVRCREGFRKLFAKCGFPRHAALKACGSRGNAFKLFTAAHSTATQGDYVGLLVDSENPVVDVDRTWDHLKRRDGWTRPDGADDEQVLLMTTCMETWITSDRGALRDHYGACLQESALPALHEMELRPRSSVQDAMVSATRTCKRRYAKGNRSFEILARLDPAELRKHLPSFSRCERILNAKLES